MSDRINPTDAVQAELLTKCRRRCCMCYALDRDARQKNGQIAHIDRISSNSAIENLAYLCLDHHNLYDSKMKQTKNYTPAELTSYKQELENYILTEWNKPILNNEILVDVFSGRFSHSSENASADLEIKYVGGNILQIKGMSFWGTNDEGGPNIGLLDCIGEISGTKAVFIDKLHDLEYKLEISFLGDKLSVSDSNVIGYFGHGVSFAGDYYRESSEQIEGDSPVRMEVMNVAVYGCFTVTNENKIVIDSDCHEINSLINTSIKSTSSKIYPYKNDILLHYSQVPEPSRSSLSYDKLNQQIKQKVYDIGHIASIHFIRSEARETFHAVVNYNEHVLNYTIPSETLQKLTNIILSARDLSRNELIDLCLNLFYLVYGQSHLDIMEENNNFKNLHYTLDGCQRLALEIKEFSNRLSADAKQQVNNFLDFWLSNCERYRAVTLANEGQFFGAVTCIIKAMVIWPYYPYKDFSSLKNDYAKRYALELIPEMNEINELFPEIDLTSEENKLLSEELASQIEFKEVPYHYVILKEIMYDTQNDLELVKFIETELVKLDDKIPFQLITKSEVIRYLKKGTNRINQMYSDRLEETLNYLRKAIELDPEFSILYTKLGSLLLIKGFHFTDQTSIEEGIEMYKKGAHFLSQLGFRMKPKTTDKK